MIPLGTVPVLGRMTPVIKRLDQAGSLFDHTGELETMLSCLIAEDEAIIGMALAEAVAQVDFRVLGAFSRCSAVLEALDQLPLDAAILDVELQDGASVAVALELQERSVPFVVYSGHHRSDVSPAFADAPWVEKPATPTEVLAALGAIMPKLSRKQSVSGWSDPAIAD